jgi:hypothetical protein
MELDRLFGMTWAMEHVWLREIVWEDVDWIHMTQDSI